MAAGEARNHHWVPQCYLKGFAKSPSKNAQLYVVDKISCAAFIASPRNVASARDFNRVDAVGVAPDHVESGYAKFESQVAPALRRMWESGQFGSAEEQNLVFNLIALLSVRTPRMRENARDFHERVLKQVMYQNIATKERYEATLRQAVNGGHLDSDETLSYEDMKDFVEREQYTIEMSTTRHVDNELNLVDTVLPLIRQRTWMLIKANHGTGGFVTSDHPVGLQWSEQKPRGFFSSPGFGLRGTEVLFPISHDLLMVGEFGGEGGVFDANQHQVAFANAAIISHATCQVYARDDKFFYLRGGGELRRGSELVTDFHESPGASGGGKRQRRI